MKKEEEIKNVEGEEIAENVENVEGEEIAENVENVEGEEIAENIENVESEETAEYVGKKNKKGKEKKAKRLKGWQIALIATSTVVAVLGGIVLGVYFGIYYGAEGVPVKTSEITGFSRVENIIGNTTINDGRKEKKIKLSELVPDVDLKDIEISGDGSIASIDGEWLTVNKIGTFELTINKKKVNYRVVDGYNVNTADEVALAAADKKNIVLQSDIKMTNIAELPSANDAIKASEAIVLYANVYGNAYTIDASHRVGSNQYSVLFLARGTDIVISNVHLIGSNPVAAEGESVVFDDYEIGGSLVKFDSSKDDRYPLDGDVAGGSIEYSILEKAHKIVWIHASDVLLKGNVIREASDACVSVQTTNLRHSDIVMEDNVLINPQVAGVLFWKIEANVKDENFAKLEIKGRFDVYNWKNEETAALMPGSEGPILSIPINTFIRGAVAGDAFDHMLIRRYGHKWVHIGIVVISSSDGENKPVITGYEEIGYRKEQFPFPKSLEGIIGDILRSRDLYGYSTFNEMDAEAFVNIDAKLFEELFGDAYIG